MDVVPKNMQGDEDESVQEKIKEDELKINMRSAELLLADFLSKMPLDHHSRAIAVLIPVLVNKIEEIGCLDSYLSSRWKSTK